MNDPKKTLLDLLEAEIDPAFRQRSEFIFQQVFKNKPKYVLDVGCGRGFYTNAIALLPYIKAVVGVELKCENILRAIKEKPNNKVTYFQDSIFTWKSNQQFDLIILSEVLEHLKNEKAVLKVLKKLLKKDGILIITVPHTDFPCSWDPINYLLKTFNTHVDKNMFWLAGIWADHERLYTKSQLIVLLEQAGYKNILLEETIRVSWPFTHFLLYGLGKNLVLRFQMDAFDRFNQNQKPLAKQLAKIFSFPDKKLLIFANKNKSVGLIGVWRKE